MKANLKVKYGYRTKLQLSCKNKSHLEGVPQVHRGLEVGQRLELGHDLVVDGVPHQLPQRQLQVHHGLREHPVQEITF